LTPLVFEKIAQHFFKKAQGGFHLYGPENSKSKMTFALRLEVDLKIFAGVILFPNAKII
jgi:hypothetical protein